MTQADDRILETLGDSDLMLSPHILSLNLDYSKPHVSRRLAKLQNAELVEKVDVGVYKITDRGRSYLMGELKEEELENVSEE